MMTLNTEPISQQYTTVCPQQYCHKNKQHIPLVTQTTQIHIDRSFSHRK